MASGATAGRSVKCDISLPGITTLKESESLIGSSTGTDETEIRLEKKLLCVYVCIYGMIYAVSEYQQCHIQKILSKWRIQSVIVSSALLRQLYLNRTNYAISVGQVLTVFVVYSEKYTVK